MKKLSIMYCCFFALFVLNIFSQDLPKVMYVNSKDGLNQRNTPDLASEKVGTLLYGERIIVYEKSGNITIDGITSCWYKTSKISGGQCWVFGGYLSDEMPSGAAPVLGYWSTDKGSNLYWNFTPRGEVRSGKKETDIGIYGNWKLTGNTLIINVIPTEFMTHQDDGPITIKITVMDKHTIVLTYSDGSTETLTRNNNLFWPLAVHGKPRGRAVCGFEKNRVQDCEKFHRKINFLCFFC